VLGTLLVLATVARGLEERGAEAVRECDAALTAGDVPLAIARAREAAESRVPWGTHVEEGYARLVALADQEEARGELPLATDAWRAVLVAARATGKEADEAERVKRAEEGIVRIAGKRCEIEQLRTRAQCEAAARGALAGSAP
jgi:hypothetical protein